MRAPLVLGLLLAAGCGEPERAASLRKEIAQIETERVGRDAVEKARAELADVESRLRAARAALEAEAGRPEGISRQHEALRRKAAAERAHAATLTRERATTLEEAQRALEEAQALDQKIARAQARALWARDQVALLAREIRPEDPAWATGRRLVTLRELVTRLQKEWAGDPVLEAAVAEVGSASPERAREIASRLGTRFARIYDLPEGGVAAGPASGAPAAGRSAEPGE